MKHASSSVRLYVALCLAEIFRIYAPDAPYEAAELNVRGFVLFAENQISRALAATFTRFRWWKMIEMHLTR